MGHKRCALKWYELRIETTSTTKRVNEPDVKSRSADKLLIVTCLGCFKSINQYIDVAILQHYFDYYTIHPTPQYLVSEFWTKSLVENENLLFRVWQAHFFCKEYWSVTTLPVGRLDQHWLVAEKAHERALDWSLAVSVYAQTAEKIWGILPSQPLHNKKLELLLGITTEPCWKHVAMSKYKFSN